MAAFEYVALSDDGKTRKGLTEADSELQVRRKLRDRGLIPVSVFPSHEPLISTGRRRTRLSAEKLALLTRLLASLVKSGMPIDDALLALSRQAGDPAMNRLVFEVRVGILEGQSLSKSMARFPEAFPDAYRATVGAGEQTRHLPLVLERLASHVEEAARMRQKLRIALIYPSLLTVTALLVVACLLAFVVPEVVRVFDSAERELPAITRWLITISDLCRNYGLYAFAAIVAFGLMFRQLLRRNGFRAMVQRGCMRLPLLGRLITESGTARFARTMAVLIDSGVTLVDSLSIASKTTSLLPLRESLSQCGSSVREGMSLSRALAAHETMPPLLTDLVANGEGSGNLAEMLDTAANTFEYKITNSLAVLVGLLEPALILIMGAIILFIVLAILLPIFDMNQLV